MKITKEKVELALINEPLAARKFFHNGVYSDDNKCEVCAVGAILRNTKRNTFNHEDAAKATDNTCDELELKHAHKKGKFLAILSTEFEAASIGRYCSGGQHWLDDTDKIPANSPDMRMFLLFLTEAFCPDVLEFEV